MATAGGQEQVRQETRRGPVYTPPLKAQRGVPHTEGGKTRFPSALRNKFPYQGCLRRGGLSRLRTFLSGRTDRGSQTRSASLPRPQKASRNRSLTGRQNSSKAGFTKVMYWLSTCSSSLPRSLMSLRTETTPDNNLSIVQAPPPRPLPPHPSENIK